MVETRGGGSDYREKYRKAVAEQEQIEKRYTAQLELLRNALLRVSAAASGLDTVLDTALGGLREKFSSGSGEEIVRQIELVSHAVDQYERERIDKSEKAAKDVSLFIENLLELNLPSDLTKSLQGFAKGLNKRLVNYKSYPEVLNELGKLQLLALNSAANPQASFWQRVKGGKTLQSPPPTAPPKSSEQISTDDFNDDMVELTAEAQESHRGDDNAPQTLNFDPGKEENYQQVAQRIAGTLEGLVNKIEPNDIVRHKVDIVKLRIKRGMDWYVLAVTLEDIRDILLLRYLQTDQDFSEYLKHVNSQLNSISEALGLAVNHGQALNESADAFSKSVSHEIGLIQKQIDESEDIGELKTEITSNLTTIENALKDFKQSQQKNASLSDQLVALVTKVQSIEQESEKTKELLEEERYKATHDPLTNLPNREAYNERAFDELQRFKRYCRPLTLAVCDIDKFKNINDTYGHQAGDKVIKLIAKLLATRVRKVDFVARYGGEEFVLILPETTAQQAYGVLDKVRAVMAKTSFRFKDTPVQITISFGIEEFQADDSVESAFERADKALYQAKEEGRNRCVIYDAETSEK